MFHGAFSIVEPFEIRKKKNVCVCVSVNTLVYAVYTNIYWF